MQVDGSPHLLKQTLVLNYSFTSAYFKQLVVLLGKNPVSSALTEQYTHPVREHFTVQAMSPDW